MEVTVDMVVMEAMADMVVLAVDMADMVVLVEDLEDMAAMEVDGEEFGVEESEADGEAEEAKKVLTNACYCLVKDILEFQ